MTNPCVPPDFTEDVSLPIGLPEEEDCCGDNQVIPPALVRYNGLYCHPGSADFSAEPIGNKRCFDPLSGEANHPLPPPPPPTTPPVIGDPPDPVEENPPEDPPDPPVEDPPLPNAPVINVRTVNNIAQTTARLRAYVNPMGAATDVYFEYGLDDTYGTQTVLQSIGSGAVDVNVIQDISGLTADTVYHWRVVAANAGGTTTSEDQQFTTTAPSPPPDPTPVTTNKFMRGFFGNWSSIGRAPFPDLVGTVQGTSFKTWLDNCRANKCRAIISCAGPSKQHQVQAGDPELDPSSEFYDPTAVIGGFSMRRTKLLIDRAHTTIPNANAYVDDGTFCGAELVDDFPKGSAVWNGDPPTMDEIDEMCRYTKEPSGWSRVPCFARGHLGLLSGKTDWQYLDAGWSQWMYRYGDPTTWFVSQVNLAIKLKLGIIFGFNLLNAGGGPNAVYDDASIHGWNIRPANQSLYGMSPAELGYCAAAAKAAGGTGTTSKGIGYIGWAVDSGNGDSTYYDRSDIQAALLSAHNLFAGLTAGPINRR